jgi:hypothetical protein
VVGDLFEVQCAGLVLVGGLLELPGDLRPADHPDRHLARGGVLEGADVDQDEHHAHERGHPQLGRTRAGRRG